MSHEPEKDDVVFVGATGRSDRSRRIAVGVAVAVVAMLGGAAVAFAATNATASPSTPSAGSTTKPPSTSVPRKCPNSAPRCPAFDRPFHRFALPPGAMFGLGFPAGAFGAIHGQMVLAKPGGGYQTLDIQRGKVTAVSAGSISVRSADGFTASYAVSGSTDVDAQRDGIGSVKAGNQVAVLATVSGSTATATSITDLTLLQRNHPAVSYGWQPAS
jgi:hypothetical protein